jgi:tetratricopeptide (TPR) repeat protein
MRILAVLLVAYASLDGAAVRSESVQDLVSRLSPEQKALWDQSSQSLNAQQYAAALAAYKQLLEQLPGDAILSKFASEAALNVGDSNFALTTLKPLTAANPDDWQAVSLMARACAESLDSACRDSNMAHLLDLHRRGMTPRSLRQYLLERLKVGDNTLVILPSLEPVGFYKIYDLGRVMDGKGEIFMRITIESGDGDQPLFAKQHPQEAAQGIRGFSLDAYRETGVNGNGQRTQTHFTYRFYVGQPPYELVRQAFLDVASGEATPVSSRTGLVVQ